MEIEEKQVDAMLAPLKDSMVKLMEFHLVVRKANGIDVDKSDELAIELLQASTKPQMIMMACERMHDLMMAVVMLVVQLKEKGHPGYSEFVDEMMELLAGVRKAVSNWNEFAVGRDSDASATEEGTTGHPASAE